MTAQKKLRKYSKLRGEMYMNSIFQTEICRLFNKSQTWLTNRLAGDECFTIDEGYEILDFLGIPHSEFTEYFPRGGFNC